MRIHSSAANHLTYHRYMVLCPESAAPQNSAVLRGELFPIYDPLDAQQEIRSMKSITEIMDLRESNISVTIIEDKDVIDICNQIDAYLREIRGMGYSEEVKVFTERLLKLREEMLRLQQRVFNLHPDWASQYYGITDGFVSLLYKFFEEAGGHQISKTVPVTQAVEDVQKVESQKLGLPPLHERIRAAEKAREVSENYATNPGAIYDSGF